MRKCVNFYPGLLRDHDNHPGHDASDCPLRETVNAATTRTMNGYRCYMTGGHCLPDEHCESRLSRATKQDLENVIYNESIGL